MTSPILHDLAGVYYVKESPTGYAVLLAKADAESEIEHVLPGLTVYVGKLGGAGGGASGGLAIKQTPTHASLLNKNLLYVRADLDTAWAETLGGNDGFTVGKFRAYIGAALGQSIVEGIRGAVNLDAGKIVDQANVGYIAGGRFTTYVPDTANVKTNYGVIIAPRDDTTEAAMAGSIYTGAQIYLQQAIAKTYSRGLDIFAEGASADILHAIAIRVATGGTAKYSYGLDFNDEGIAPAIIGKALLRSPNEVCCLEGNGAPVDGTTGDNFAGPGSLYFDYTNGVLYVQTAVKTAPVWQKYVSGITASAAELNILDGVTATAAELNAVADNQAITAAGDIPAKRLVVVARTAAPVDAPGVMGVAPAAILTAASGAISCSGLQPVVADCPLAVGDGIKAGTAGRATKHTTSQTTIQTAIAGEATAFSQPGAATALEIVQAADVAADRGRGIVIEGSDAGGVAITETITLNAANTTTPHAGAVSFTRVSAVYMADGAVLGAQAVTVRASGAGATVCTLGAGASELAADTPTQSQEAYCNELTITGPNTNATFVTVVGINSADAAARERCTLDGASPSKITTATVWRLISRICLGEFTNAAAGDVKTNATTDTAGMKCGIAVTAAAARGDDALVLVKPNA
ncbi:MAG: hypothetical protein M0Z94_08360 [Dehalococcoidales bacterium]|nr:hypothetical protein [Dehalococcoidales bacterium]